MSDFDDKGGGFALIHGKTAGGDEVAIRVDANGVISITSSAQLPASLGQKAMAASLPVVVASDQSEIDTSMGRRTPDAPLTLTYDAAVDPTTFINVKGYAGFEIGPIPAAADGLTMTLISGDDTAKTGVGVPYFYNSSDAKTAFPTIAVNTGDRILFKADAFPVWFMGLRFGGAWTGTIPVRPKG